MKFVYVLTIILCCWTLFSGNSSDSIKYGVPGKQDYVLVREGYSVGYSNKNFQPYWASYILTRDKVLANVCNRADDFRPDPATYYSATLADYRGSGYDRGHIVPAADMHWSTNAMSESFLLTNMSPQTPAFNRGIWKDLESWVRCTASNEVSIAVVTGPVFYTNTTHKVIGKSHKITVPDGYYKVIYDETEPKKMIGFLLPNEGSTNSLRSFSCTVDKVEEITGLDFFNLLDSEIQERLESESNPNQWENL